MKTNKEINKLKKSSILFFKNTSIIDLTMASYKAFTVFRILVLLSIFTYFAAYLFSIENSLGNLALDEKVKSFDQRLVPNCDDLFLQEVFPNSRRNVSIQNGLQNLTIDWFLIFLGFAYYYLYWRDFGFFLPF